MYHAPNTNGFVNLFIAFKPISFCNVVWKTTSILSRHQCVNYNDYVSCVCRQGYSYLSTFCRLGHHQRSWEDVKRRWENIKKRGMFQNNFPPFLHLLYVIYIFQDFSIEQLCHKCSIHSLNESVSQKLRHQFKNTVGTPYNTNVGVQKIPDRAIWKPVVAKRNNTNPWSCSEPQILVTHDSRQVPHGWTARIPR